MSALPPSPSSGSAQSASYSRHLTHPEPAFAFPTFAITSYLSLSHRSPILWRSYPQRRISGPSDNPSHSTLLSSTSTYAVLLKLHTLPRRHVSRSPPFIHRAIPTNQAIVSIQRSPTPAKTSSDLVRLLEIVTARVRVDLNQDWTTVCASSFNSSTQEPRVCASRCDTTTLLTTIVGHLESANGSILLPPQRTSSLTLLHDDDLFLILSSAAPAFGEPFYLDVVSPSSLSFGPWPQPRVSVIRPSVASHRSWRNAQDDGAVGGRAGVSAHEHGWRGEDAGLAGTVGPPRVPGFRNAQFLNILETYFLRSSPPSFPSTFAFLKANLTSDSSDHVIVVNLASSTWAVTHLHRRLPVVGCYSYLSLRNFWTLYHRLQQRRRRLENSTHLIRQSTPRTMRSLSLNQDPRPAKTSVDLGLNPDFGSTAHYTHRGAVPEVAMPYRTRSRVSMGIMGGEESVDD
ncbi:hypothetical protein GALMADRAFT_147646 [Galerina marginata CBS 339.88]|uniref:Uncharacterized protein n=1 Tax=Galerina marginata (strain CBS 339.88) TaxID=685588 RepID=A0A067SA24_GALM3|nr:hypothetical protein GALMADRAFT_147646 [Galerina marginata CBS 339.88]